jgi:hypothetical protein
VTRLKTNTPLNKPREILLDPGSPLLSDRIGFLPARQAMNRKNPMQDVGSARSLSRPRPARHCAPHQGSRRARSGDRGSVQALLAVEQFFPVMKQTPKITRFVGRSENALRIQIAVFFCALCRSSRKKRMASSNSFVSCARTSCTEKT